MLPRLVLLGFAAIHVLFETSFPDQDKQRFQEQQINVVFVLL